MGVFFIAGVYGVGKSTIGEIISENLKVPIYDASKLISDNVDEQYSLYKDVSDIDLNQKILLKEVNRLLKTEKQLILNGHFCIFSKSHDVIHLPKSVYNDLKLEKIILIESSIDIVMHNLMRRQGKSIYTHGEMKILAKMEKKLALQISNELNIPLMILEYNNNKNIIREIEEEMK